MVGIKDFEKPSCCMNCEMFDGEYGNCDIIGDTQDFEYQWNENRPFDCPLVEAIPKAEYENRLKADMVAMLADLLIDVEEIESREQWCDYANDNCISRYDVEDLIQQKINALKAETEDQNGQTSN